MSTIIRVALTVFLIGFQAIFVAGCETSPRLEVSVSSLVAPGGDAFRQYALVPGNEGVKADDLQFREFAEFIERAMKLQGFIKASAPESADLLVVAAYSVGDPQTRTYTYTVPHWGQTGVSSSTTHGTAITQGTLNTSGNSGTYSGTTSYSGTTYYQPTYGITGYSSGVGQYTTVTRVLALAGFDADSIRSGGDPKELWRVSAVSIGSTRDLRLVFPYLITAARPYIGKATDQAVTVSFSKNDPRVAEVRSTPPLPTQNKE